MLFLQSKVQIVYSMPIIQCTFFNWADYSKNIFKANMTSKFISRTMLCFSRDSFYLLDNTLISIAFEYIGF